MARDKLIAFRRGTAAAWTSANPTLAAGEPGYETDTGKVKIGDGTTAWASLAYLSGGGSPTGAAGGSLSGTYPNPGIATGAVGPTELASTAVTPATYGDSSHVGQFTVDADGRITGASSIAIPGVGSGGSVKLYDYLVAGSDKASIDSFVDGTTAANFAGYTVLAWWFIGRTDDAGANVGVNFTVNNDAAGNYDVELVGANNAAVAGTPLNAQSSWAPNAPGAGSGANYPMILRGTIPFYTDTTFYKTGEITTGKLDTTAGNNFSRLWIVSWRNAAAITRLKVAASGTAKLKVGSHLAIYGW